ncbi:MAG TPA: hypothetical protein VMX97_00600 [Hyphomicrobiaceae bacterium]|nr:hypothetical protein [Hyphomicrobiaceae bacterium]
MTQAFSMVDERTAIHSGVQPKDIALSAALIVALPVVFWMLVLEGGAALLGLLLNPAIRLAAFGLASTFLGAIWALMLRAD